MNKLQLSLGTAAFLGLLMTPLLGVAQPVSSDELEVIQGATVFAPGAPHGDWSRINEEQAFYLTAGANCAAPALTYAAPGTASCPVGPAAGSRSFAMPAAQANTRPVTYSALKVRITATCAQDVVTGIEPSLTVTIGGGVSLTADIESEGGGPAQIFEHTFTSAPLPLTRPAGAVLTLTVASTTIPCVVSTGPGSFLAIISDSASMNPWPVDKDGAPIRSLPHASKVTADKRVFGMHVAYVSAWPCLNHYSEGGTSICTTTPGADLMDWYWGSAAPTGFPAAAAARPTLFSIRLRDVADQTTSALTQEEATHQDLNLSTQARMFRYSYTNALDEGTYRIEVVSSDGGIAATRNLNIGGKGFEIFSVDGQIHRVNPGEPTTFRVRALNTGAERDTITFSFTQSVGSWEVRPVNTAVTLEPNAQGEAIFRVTPPANAIAGQNLEIPITAASSFPQEVTPQSMTLRVELDSAVQRGASISGGTSAMDVGPGDSIDIAGMRLKNDGTRVGTYVISTSFSPAAPQWSAVATPPSRTVDAASVDDFSLRLTVPTTAIAGETHKLSVKATLLGETQPRATKDIDLTVVFTPALDVTPFRSALSLRDDATADGSADTDHDRDAVYRLQLSNPTSVEQSFTVAGGFTGGSNCAWRMAWSEGGAFTTPGTTLPSGTTVAIPPQSTKDAYVKLNWITPPQGCTRVNQQATLTFTSTLEPSFRVQETLAITIAANNARIRAPAAEPDRAPGVDQLVDPNGIAVRESNEFTPAVYDFRVVSDGNEFDNFLVEIPPASKAGWTQTIAFVAAESVAGTGSGGTCAPSPAGSQRVFRCNMIGAGDHMVMRLTVTPNSNIPLGQTLDTPIIVTSLDDPDNKANLAFRTRTVGSFDHDSSALRGVTDVERQRTAALPFVIQNVGTNGDQFTVSITGGNTVAWKARFATSLGLSQDITVPARSDFVSYLLVEGPNSQVTETFTLQVQSLATGKKTSFSMDARTVTVPTGAGAFNLAGDPTNNFLLATRGAGNDVTVKLTGGTDGLVTFTADNDALPEAWRIEQPSKTGNIAGGTAQATFSVVPPSGALGTSEVPLRIKAQSGSVSRFVDLVLTLESEAGVEIRVVGDEIEKFVPPGGPTSWDLEIVNLGLGQAVMTLASTQLPPGWVVDLGAPQISVAPLSSQTRTIQVFVPANADPRANVTFSISASSAQASDQVTLHAIVGFREIVLDPATTRLTGAPEETLTFAVGVLNNGTLQDRVQFTATVVTPGYQDQVTATVLPGTTDLLSAQGRDVLVNVQLGGTVPPDVDVTVRLVASSLFAPANTPVTATRDLVAHVLKFVSADVDADLVDEFAVDRNEDASDGFEEFRDSLAPGGRRSVSADLARFLASGTLAPIDGDGDGKRDHFIDHTGDGLPDAYWDPDEDHSMALTVVKDVDADSVADYFVDTSGDGTIDRLYNVRTGAWTAVLARDIDGDGTQDYAVDKNGNGIVDSDETVLYSRGGILVKVLKVDVDGDGKLDDVFDLNGDDRVDSFVRFGETQGRTITLRDVNGDGVLDWTYDSNGDGRADRYYDPVAQTGGHKIDPTQNFVDLVSKYWFIPALFVLVLVLFIVLVAVTRR